MSISIEEPINHPDLRYEYFPNYISRFPDGVIGCSKYQNRPGYIKYIISHDKEKNECEERKQLQIQKEIEQLKSEERKKYLIKLMEDLQNNLITREEFYKKINL